MIDKFLLKRFCTVAFLLFTLHTIVFSQSVNSNDTGLNNSGSLQNFQPSVIRYGATVTETQNSLAGACKSINTRRINPAFMKDVKDKQMQIDCDGFQFLGKPRHAEFVFRDDSLEMVWIMTSTAEQDSILKTMTNLFGVANNRNIEYFAFTNSRTALRVEPAEVLFYSQKIARDIESFFEKPRVPVPPEGRWTGEYRIGNKQTYIYAGFKMEKDELKGALRTPLNENKSYPFTKLSVSPPNLHFETTMDSETLAFDGQIKGSMMTGTVSRGGLQGSFKLIQVLDDKPDHFNPYRGDYQIAPNHFLILGRSLFDLYYRDTKTGRTGPLRRIAEDTYSGGVSLGVDFPIDIKITFIKDITGEITGLNVSQSGSKELSARKVKFYAEEEVSFQNGDVTLSGTLKKPLKPGRHPVIVLLHGANASSRYGLGSFLEFVGDNFARNGYAVLSYDKRGTGRSTGKSEDTDLDKDALAGIQLLRSRLDINPKQIGVWGISQGGQIASKVAALAGDVAFIINTSGNITGGQEGEIDRTELQLRADGYSEDEVRNAVELQKLKFHYANTGMGWDEYIAAAEKGKDKKWFSDPYVGAPLTKDSSAWEFWRRGTGGLQTIDYYAKFTGPVLMIFGENETFGSSQPVQFTTFKQAMEKSGKTNYTMRLIPSANHSMMLSRNGGYREMPMLKQFASGYFELMTSWLMNQLKGKNRK